ncbi:hypothetical protein HHI36_000682 [Cryptolaemus montrouzieri]|uniref:Osteopontin n=1 Tax=Cryptolaemus montrouzieri TaxID=559131 RepID=A0ABD2P5P0_9CUCU
MKALATKQISKDESTHNPIKHNYTQVVAKAENRHVHEEDVQSSDSDSDDSENNSIEDPFRDSDNSSDDMDYEPDENNSDSESSDADEAIIDGNIAKDTIR